MKKLKIYLDTSIINFLYYELAPDYQEATIEFFDNFIKNEKYETYISAYVIDEINATKDIVKKERLFNTFNNYPINTLIVESYEEIQLVADYYIQNNIIPEKKYLDALHIAISLINGIDYLVSWNFRHLANVNKERLIQAANLNLGFTKIIRITTPLELINYESEIT